MYIKKNHSKKLKFTFSFDLSISKIPGFIFIFLALQHFIIRFYLLIGSIILDKYLMLPKWLFITLAILNLILVFIAFIISLISYNKESEKLIRFLYICLSSSLFIVICSNLISFIYALIKFIL